MPVSGLKFESLPHAIFLQRVSGPESATTLEARLGQGAFLALRLVDLLASDRRRRCSRTRIFSRPSCGSRKRSMC